MGVQIPPPEQVGKSQRDVGTFSFLVLDHVGGIKLEFYHLYILYSPKLDQYYIGISHHPEKRLYYHNSSHKGWTRRGRPWLLIYSKVFESRAEAQKWEKWIKSQRDRSIIEKIIRRDFDWHI